VKRPLLVGLAILWASVAAAQPVSQRGLLDLRGVAYPQVAPNDPQRGIYEALFREEVFVRPAAWLQFAAGLDLRWDTHDQVEDEWRLDVEDRAIRRPRAALRRLSATVSAGGFTVDIGKQFIRWGRADVTYPTDRFAPRDFLNVFDAELLPVIGVRPSLQLGNEVFEAVWLPQLTPSRLPLFTQRWTAVPPELVRVPIVDNGSHIPQRSQFGARWRHTGNRLETALSYFDGLNHLPNVDVQLRGDSTVGAMPSAIELTRVYPEIRMYGADAAIPTGWLTWKLEAAYVKSPSRATEEYVLYVIEAERQVGEWVLDMGYTGDVVTREQGLFPFAPDRGIARSLIGRAAYTIDPRQTVAVEGAIRQRAEGYYARVEYSLVVDRHSRLVLSGAGIGGDADDFIGQYRRNSHVAVTLRFNF
jgi:hypothetical protein